MRKFGGLTVKRFQLLSLLVGKDLTTNELRDAFAERFDSVLALGSVHTTMDRLEGMRLVEQKSKPAPKAQGGRPRRVYHLTAAGRTTLDRAELERAEHLQAVKEWGLPIPVLARISRAGRSKRGERL